MSLGVCIPDLIASGQIPASRAKEAQQLYDELVLQYEGRFGRAAAEGMATAKAVEAMERAFLDKKRQALLTVKAQATVLDNARRLYAGGKYADGPIGGDAMLASLVRDEKAPFANVEYRWHNVKQTALAAMYDLLAKHRAGLTGHIREKSDFMDVLRELHGADTGNLNARELAEGWRAASEFLRRRFNAAGGSIGQLDNWGLPHSHDPMRVGAVSAEAWIDEIAPMLDRARMVDAATGLPMSDARLRTVLRDTYEAIVSDGWSRREPGKGGGMGALANGRAEQRFLHFKAADDWLAYNDRFGGAEPLDAMLAHVDHMARDIAMMEILGPNPAATIRWMKDSIAKDAFTVGTVADRLGVAKGEYAIDRVFREIMGMSNRPVNRRLALAGSTLRNWQTSTKLGSAVLSSFSDAGTQALTRYYNGLDAVGTIGDYARQLNPLDAADREFARRAGIIGDEFTGKVIAGGRAHMDELFGGRLQDGAGWLDRKLETSNEMSRRLADGTLRVSGLNAWTVAGREAMYREFADTFTRRADEAFEDLPPLLQGFFQRYGMGREAWNEIRRTARIIHKGVDWIDPSQVPNEALRDRLMEAMLTEMDFAVPTGGLYQRSIVNAYPRGTFMGELIRTGFQFKMFPVTVMAMHGQRMLAQSNLANKAAYAAAFLGVTTLTGMLGLQMGEMAKLKDPLPMGDRRYGVSPEFLKRAMLKGGGLGVYGDVIEGGLNEHGQDIGDVTKGPAYGTAQTVADFGKAWATGEGRGRATANLLKREVPGSSLWFVRGAYERVLVDTVGEWADPDYSKSYGRMMKRAADQGQGAWWAPGAAAPARAPDLENAFSAAPDS